MSDRLVLALVTFLTVIALVFGAPALDGTTDGADGSGVSTAQERPTGVVQIQGSPDTRGVVIAVFLAFAGLALAYGLRQYGRDDAVLAVLTTVVLTAAAAVAVARPPGVSGTFGVGPTNGSVVDSVTSGASPQESLWALGAVGSFVVVALAGVVLLRGTGTETWESTDDGATDEADDGSDPPTELGDAAGRAADRLTADAPPENAVYGAWEEMTDALDVPNPAASTPGEFAAAAERAGMDADDVATLTDLFESVRYGDSAPTEARERQAERALRDIERAYGSEP